MTLGDLVFPSATKVIIPGGLPLECAGLPTCVGDYHYTKIYAVYETYSQKGEVPVDIRVVVDGVTYMASGGTLRKM
jgi:hypothetical protein